MKEVDVVCFGEALMDLLPGGPQPGGAPLNVAVHLQHLGVETTMISRVGMDRYGDRLLDFLHERGVNTHYIQKDKERETGTVRVNLDKPHDPVYTIIEKVAWDFINDSFLSNTINPKYIIHGSLVSRSVESFRSLEKLKENGSAKIVLDLNVRSPHYSKSIIDGLLQSAHIVKMNAEEFKMVKEWFYIKNPREQGDFRAIRSLYPNIETVIVTKGSKGATGWQIGKMETVKSSSVDVINTVGCGDAFLAAFISSTENGKEFKEALQFANATAELVANHQSANPTYTKEDVYAILSNYNK